MAVRRIPYIGVASGSGVHPPLPLARPGTSPGEVPSEVEATAAQSFGQILTDAIRSIDGLQKQADTDVNRVAAGEEIDLHQVMISLEKANVAFQLGLQARTKLLEAYQEVMRMPL